MELQLESIFDNHFDHARFFENNSAINHDVGFTNPFDEFDIEVGSTLAVLLTII